MPFRYIHVTLIYADFTQDVRELEPMAILLGKDWLRYSPNTWFLWTDKTPTTCAEMMRSVAGENDLVLAHVADSNIRPDGRMPTWVWDWLNKSRDPITGHVPPTGDDMPSLKAMEAPLLQGQSD